MKKKLLMISTDKLIFDEKSVVRARQVEYATDWDEVHIVILNKRERQTTQKTVIAIAPNCWVYPTNSMTKWLYPFDAIRRGRLIVKDRKIETITCQDPFLTGMVGVSLKKTFQLPLEIQVHTDIGSPNYAYTLGNKIRKIMARLLLRNADTIRVVSDRIRTYLENAIGINDSKIIVRPIKVDIESIQSASIIVDLHKKYPQFGKIVLMASRLEPEKNIKLAINAWPAILTKMPDVGLVIVGEGSQGCRLDSLISRQNLKQNIILEGLADRQTLFSYFKTADLFLNTSWYEGYGLTLVEAKAAGCKILSTDVGVATEVGAGIVGWDSASVTLGILNVLEE